MSENASKIGPVLAANAAIDSESDTVSHNGSHTGAPPVLVTRAVQRDPKTGRYVKATSWVPGERASELGVDTRFGAGNDPQARKTHGVRAFEARGVAALPLELRDALDVFRTGVTVDQGGETELTTLGAGYVRKLTTLEAVAELLAADIARRGLFTPRGRVRNTYFALLKTLEQWDRFAQRLGMTRKQKAVPTLAEYLSQLDEPDTSDTTSDPTQDGASAAIAGSEAATVRRSHV